MSADSFHPRSVDVSLFKYTELRASSPAVQRVEPQLPIYVAPMADEVFLSWLLRLAGRLNVSMRTLTRDSFGIQQFLKRSHWRARPHPWLLTRISQKTGVSVRRLREMTFIDWHTSPSNDDANSRFSGRYFYGPRREGVRFAVCGQCLHEDAQPYIRLHWLIGWVAMCPVHVTTLMTRCPGCKRALRAPSLGVESRVSFARCVHCSAWLVGGKTTPADESALRLQITLLTARRHGGVQIQGIGAMTWIELVALLDALLRMMWKPVGLPYWLEDWHIGAELPPLRTAQCWDGRYGSLLLLAWLLDGWPHGTGAQVAIGLLARYLGERRRGRLKPCPEGMPFAPPDPIEPPTEQRLTEILNAALSARMVS